MKRYVITLVAFIAPLLSAEEIVRRVVELKYSSANQVNSLLQNFGANSRSDERLRVIVLSGTLDSVTQAEAAIRKLDVPPPPEKNIELLAYLVMASNEPQTVPESADLAQVTKQMRTLLPYKSYRLMDTIWVRTKTGGGAFEASGLAPASLKTDPNFNPTYVFSAHGVWALDFEPRNVRISDLNLTLTLREKTVVKIVTNVDVREGQKVVIGKTNPTGADSAVVLIITAKIVD